MNKEEEQQLKSKVLKNRVKKLCPQIKSELDTLGESTLIANAVKYLTLNGLLPFPFNDDYETVSAIPRYQKLQILMFWIPKDIPGWEGFSDFKKLYHYLNNIQTIPKCKMCDKNVEWSESLTHRGTSNRYGYKTYCGTTCRTRDEELRIRTKETCLERYGNTGLLNDPNHFDKAKQACLEKHGVPFNLQRPSVLAQTKQTQTELYGERRLPIVEKTLSTLHTKFELSNDLSFGQVCSTVNSIKQRRVRSLSKTKWNENIEHFKYFGIVPLYDFSDYETGNRLLPYGCKTCGTEFESKIINGLVPRCPSCYPLNNTNWAQNEVQTFIEQELKLSCNVNDRITIKPKELDLVIPSKRVAIEFNGLYWHNDLNDRITKNYHFDKSNECSLQRIRLLHLFEDEWINQSQIVKSIITAACGCSDTIYGRQTEVRPITHNEADEFIRRNHIQGNVKSKIQIGLFHDGILVSAMTFGASRYDKQYEWELLRFCTKHRLTVIGGAQKMFKYFLLNHQANNVISYCDFRLFDGEIYKKLGFILTKINPPGYWYINLKQRPLIRENRLKYQKHKLKTILSQFDPALTEYVNMVNNGFARVWDSGQLVFVWQR